MPGGVLRLEGLPGRYESGRRYLLTVVLESEAMGRAGFQLATRFAEGDARGKQAGTVEPVDARTRTVRAPDTGVLYAGHTAQGAETADPSLASWTRT